MKDALALIRRWYEKKILSPDFFTKGGRTAPRSRAIAWA